MTASQHPSLYDQTHSIDLNFNFKHSHKWQYNISWLYHSGWLFTNGHLFDSAVFSTLHGQVIYPNAAVKLEPYNLDRLPAYHRLDIRLTRNFAFKNSRLGVFLEVINAYGRKNVRNVEFGIEQAAITDEPDLEKTNHKFLRVLASIGITWDR